MAQSAHVLIDYKNGKVTWDNSYNWERPDDSYAYEQDILQIHYGACTIDVGNYSNNHGGRHFVIMVIDFTGMTEDQMAEAWSSPYASIPCRDKEDMLVQLQRAIDLYPEMIAHRRK